MRTSTGIYRDTDLLTWVGERAYPTIDEFVREAQLLGCSRRLPGLMKWIIPGQTRVFLVHKNGIDDESYGALFGFFTINSVHIIYDDIDDGIPCGRNVGSCYPVLSPGVEPPRNRVEFVEYIVKRKIIIKRCEGIVTIDKLLDELWKEWLKDAIKSIIQDGVRYIPWSVEADNLERFCGGVSGLGSGRYPGAYASDELGDWILDQILDWLLDEPELPEEYFWEEVIEENVTVHRRRKQKKAPLGTSRSRRIDIDEIHHRYGEPPRNIQQITVFDKPYPLYYHPPKASFRGFQRIDGNSLLLKVNLPQYILP
jgi:hypothetical protein